MMKVEFFTNIFTIFQDGIIATLNGKSAAIISLISPVLGIGFALYLMLIAAQAMRGTIGAENFMDFFLRCIGWAAVITFGLNISYYFHVADFFNGLGADLSGAISGTPAGMTSGAVLDGMVDEYAKTVENIWSEAKGITQSIVAACSVVILFLSGAILLGVSAGFILLAQVALGVLLAIGPIFISLALFPATRKFFDAWIGQCTNYVLLTVLFNFLFVLQGQVLATAFAYKTAIFLLPLLTLITGVLWILVAFNMPALASALAGGVGISAMVGNAAQGARAMMGGFGKMAGAVNKMRGGGGSGGGEIKKGK